VLDGRSPVIVTRLHKQLKAVVALGEQHAQQAERAVSDFEAFLNEHRVVF
jgi:hypothetical protein